MNDQLLTEFLDQEYTAARDVRPNTITQYHWVIRCFAKHLGRPAKLSDLNRVAVNAWLVSIGNQLAADTVKSRRMTILSLWRLAAELGYVDSPRLIRQARKRDRILKTIGPDDVRRLVAAARQLPGEIHGIGRAVMMTTLITATWETALRQSDLFALDWPMVRAADGRLQIVQIKTGHRRWVHFSGELLNEIAAWHPGSGPVWPHLSGAGMLRNLRWACRLAGLPPVTHTDLRKAAITEVERRQPGSGWIFAGHSSPATTQGWYIDGASAYRDIRGPRL
jgi:integrase